MKNCISVINIPIDNRKKMYDLCIDSIRRYSKKYSIDLIEFNTFKINTNSIVFEKFQNLDLFNMGYDRVLQIDADVLINPKSENIFEVYNDSSCFYAFQENKNLPGLTRNEVVESFPKNFDWPKVDGLYKYFNAGIYLFSRDQYEVLSKWRIVLRDLGDTPFCEQDILNYLIFSSSTPFEEFDYNWNRMDLGVPDPSNQRRLANFIHYAGRGYSFFEEKEFVVLSDYNYFYKNL